jgi:hypothetical protein
MSRGGGGGGGGGGGSKRPDHIIYRASLVEESQTFLPDMPVKEA